jgi:hypothetical protein
MTDVVISSEDVIVTVEQPTVPPTALPPNIGLVEIEQVILRGSIWLTGSGAPVTPGGQTGDLYLDVTTGDIYRWQGNAWVYQGTFAPATLTAAQILAELITVDGAGSGLDADLLDGQHGAYYATQTDMTAVQNTNTTQDTNINRNAANILTNANNVAANTTAINSNATAISTETTNRTNADNTLQANINLKANIASPVFTGDPQAPTAGVGDNDTSIATTQFVTRALAALPPSGIPDAPNDGLTYGRKNLAWATVVGGAAPSDTPPPGPLVNGQLWWKSSSGVLYLYYNDGNSSQWVQAAASTASQPGLADIDMQGHNIINVGTFAVSGTGNASFGGGATFAGSVTVGGNATVNGVLAATGGIRDKGADNILQFDWVSSLLALWVDGANQGNLFTTTNSPRGGGYVKFANGLIINYGSMTTDANGNAGSGTFGLVFPTAIVAAFAQVNVGSALSPASQVYCTQIAYPAANSVSCQVRQVNNGGSVVATSGTPVYWLAVGY